MEGRVRDFQMKKEAGGVGEQGSREKRNRIAFAFVNLDKFTYKIL
jgi:hypothetical protein